MNSYVERLAARTREVDSFVCVGLDPDANRTPVEKLVDYNRAIIEATAPYAACYKPNLAFYEQYGVPGLRALEATLQAIPAGIPVIGDGKRGDISSTAEAYARAMFEAWRFDATTVNPLLGRDSVEPFLAYEDRGVYILCRTSNPGAADFQHLEVGGEPLFERVAREATAWAPNAGLVVGATAPAELERVRAIAPRASLLIPGVGTQGGDPEMVMKMSRAEPGLVVVNASRSIYYAGEGAQAPAAAAEAARKLRDALAGAVPIS